MTKPSRLGTLVAVTDALRELRVVSSVETLRRVSQAVREASKPRDLIVLVMDRRNLAKDSAAQRASTLHGILSGLSREFPEFQLGCRSRERPQSEAS